MSLSLLKKEGLDSHVEMNLVCGEKELMCWALSIFSPSEWLEWGFSFVQVLAIGFGESGSPVSQHKSWVDKHVGQLPVQQRLKCQKGMSKDSSTLSPQSKKTNPKGKNGILNYFIIL